MRIAHGPRLPNIREMIRLSSVEPGSSGRIFHPGMIRAGVICDFVLNDFDTDTMRCIDQLAQLLKRSEVFFDAVEIDCAVSMIVRDHSLRTIRPIGILLAFIEMVNVVVPRRQPDGRYPEVFKVRQMLNDPFKIAAMIITSF